jgi:hypothetical protein
MTNKIDFLFVKTVCNFVSGFKRKFLYLWAICFLCSFFLSPFAIAGEFYRSTNQSPCTSWLSFKGQIESGDAKRFAAIISSEQKRIRQPSCSISQISLNLDSDGGDVAEALRFGRIIRENDVMVTVGIRDQCLSSCIYLVAGGVQRLLVGKVGIHRPYFSDLRENSNKEQVRRRIENLERNIIDYLKEMNVSPMLHDDSMSVPPEQIKILTDFELTRYRLTGEDFSYNERKIKEQASLYNLSSSEYRVRKNAADAQCTNIKDLICPLKVYTGASEQTLRIRLERVKEFCKNVSLYREFLDCYKRYVVEGK